MRVLPFAPKVAVLAATLASWAPRVGAQEPRPIPPLPSQSARTQKYTIAATLSDDLANVRGSVAIELTNPSPGPIDHLELHLYWNGWRNTQATWLREQDRGLGRRSSRKVHQDSYAAIDLRTMRLTARGKSAPGGPPKLEQAIELLPRAKFIAPDDGNPDDETVLSVPLADPLAAGESLALEIEFESVVPRVIARTGRKDDFLLFAHWYPQLGVYERKTDGSWGWNCHQFHAVTEFFGEYANYDVTLTLPGKYDGKVGATGSMVEGPTRSGDSVRYRFVQEDVHNFAWTADPSYVVEKRRFKADEAELDPKYAAQREFVRKATGLPIEELRLRDVDVTLLLQPEHAGQADRHFRAVTEGLRWYGLWYGRYPYPTLTVVDPRYGSDASGMEYPTLFTAGTRIDPPPRSFTPEGVTIHEFGHQHFYGLLGSNEFEHAWLDEGMNTYSTDRTLAMAYGDEWTQSSFGPRQIEGRPLLAAAEPESALARLLTLRTLASPTLRVTPGISIFPDDPALRWYRDIPFLTYVSERRPPLDVQRSRFLSAGYKNDRMDRPTFLSLDGATGGHNAYSKPAMALHTLERIVGPVAWARVMRAYAARYRFQHPRPEDFFETLFEFGGAEFDGAPLSRFLQQVFHGSDGLDYGVSSATTRELPRAAGWFGHGADRKLVTAGAGGGAADPKDTKKLYESEFVVARIGDVIWPVKIEWKCEGTSPESFVWDGVERWCRKTLPAGPKLEWVRVDPERKLWIDDDLSNNSFRLEGEGRPALRWSLRALLGVQSQLSYFGSVR